MARPLPLLLLVLLAGCGAERAEPRAEPPAPAAAPASADEVFVYEPGEPRPAAPRPAVRKVAPIPPPVPDPPRTGDPARVSAGAPSDAEVRRDLARALGVDASRDLARLAELSPGGLAAAPPAAPDAVEAVVRAGNRVAHAPYVYGGGHGRFIDTAYDCSGSISFALAAAGLLGETMNSTRLAAWGRPGPGKWITVYANAGHAFMVVAGLRFDTSGRDGDRGSRWQQAPRSVAGFVARHPAGL